FFERCAGFLEAAYSSMFVSRKDSTVIQLFPVPFPIAPRIEGGLLRQLQEFCPGAAHAILLSSKPLEIVPHEAVNRRVARRGVFPDRGQHLFIDRKRDVFHEKLPFQRSLCVTASKIKQLS